MKTSRGGFIALGFRIRTDTSSSPPVLVLHLQGPSFHHALLLLFDFAGLGFAGHQSLQQTSWEGGLTIRATGPDRTGVLAD